MMTFYFYGARCEESIPVAPPVHRIRYEGGCHLLGFCAFGYLN